MSPAERFAALVAEFSDRPGVSPPSGAPRFGGSALKVEGAIFAMLHDDRLVVKLPAERVQELIASGGGVPFRNGRSSPMRQWLVVADEGAWAALADEALRAAHARD